MGAGLGYSPLILFAPAPFKYMPWQNIKPSLKLELSVHPKYTFNFGYQLESYKYDIHPELLVSQEDYYNPTTASSKVKANMGSMTFDIRKYSNFMGYLAPNGRYLMYGFSINNTRFNVDNISITVPNQANDSIRFDYPTHRFITKTIGLRFGYGNKKYLDDKLKTFLEFQMHFDIKLGDFGSGLSPDDLPKYYGINRVSYETAMRLSQMTSLFQFNLIYGFSY